MVTASKPMFTVKDYRHTFCFSGEDRVGQVRHYFCSVGAKDVIVSYELQAPMSHDAKTFEDIAGSILWTIVPAGVYP
jgi:hypothetical protein